MTRPHTPDRPPVATLTGERCGAMLTVEREVIVEVDAGPLPRVDVAALAEFLAMVRRVVR